MYVPRRSAVGRHFTPLAAAVLLVWIAIATAFIGYRATSATGHADSSQAQPDLGILVDEHLRVVSVDWSGSAARAGIQPGDVLKKIAGTRLPAAINVDPRNSSLPTSAPQNARSSNDVKEALQAAVPEWNRSVEVILDRDGRTVALKVLITGIPFHYDSANPQPTVTPVPTSLDSTTFYL